MNPTVSIIILNNNSPYLTISCVYSLLKYTKNILYEIIIVENGSTDDSYKLFKKEFQQFKTVKIVTSKKNVGFGRGHNLGFSHSLGKYVLFLNCDMVFYENTVQKLVALHQKLSKHTAIGFIQSILFHDVKKKNIQITCSKIPTIFNVIQENIRVLQGLRKQQFRDFRYSDWSRKTSRYVDVICGAAMFCTRDFFETVGKFDPRFFLYFEEYDICQRATQKGYKNYFTVETGIIHIEGQWPTPYWQKKMIYLVSFIQYMWKWHLKKLIV